MKLFKFFFLLSVLIFSANNLSSQCGNPPTYNDPASQTGNLEAMNIPCAWTITNGSPNIAVAVVDAYISNDHTDLTNKVVEIVGNCNPAQGDWSHGNQSLGAVAGIRNNGVCIAGSGGDTKVAGFCGYGSDFYYTDIMNRGYKIISVGHFSDGSTTKAKMEELTANGVVVLLAGLNQHHEADEPNGLHSVPGVIHCGRARMNGDFWQYNQDGSTLPNMNFDVLSVPEFVNRLHPGNICNQSGGGTSIGTPHIAGVVALMMDVNPCLTPSDYEEILVQTSLAIPANAPPGTTRGGVIDAYAAVQMAQSFQGLDKVWSGNQTITMEQVSGDLTIESGANIILTGKLQTAANTTVLVKTGARLEITGTAEMGEDAKFIVQRGAEMIVNGGTITNAKGPNPCFEANQWEGIFVEGNASQAQQLPDNVNDPNKNGVLHLRNATLMNGHTFIKMASNHIPFPDRPQYWGGHVTATGTTFTNDNNFTNYTRVAEFMQYFGEDRSSFTGCTISNVAGGMTHWSNYGVTYNQNTFDTYQRHALLTYDASIKVINGNIFDNGNHTEYDQAAIDLYQTYPINGASNIGGQDLSLLPNQFYGGYHSIFSEAGNPMGNPILIRNNNFVGGQYNMYFSGISRHDINRNDLISPVFGTTLVSNGVLHNMQRDNQFSSNDVGIFTFYDNSGYEMLSNCFDYSDRKDVRLHFTSSSHNIQENQGNIFIAASNVFSSSLVARRIEISGQVSGPSDPLFSYWIEKNTPQSDRTVPSIRFINEYGSTTNNVSSTYNIFDSKVFDNDICGSSGTPGPVNTSPYSCNLPFNCEDLPQFIDDLEVELDQEIAALQNASANSTSWYQIRYKITEILKCLQRAKIKWIFCNGKNQQYQPLIPEFQSDDFLYRTYVFGTMLSNQDYAIARTYLASINPTTEEEIDFVTTQEINLDRLEDFNFVPSSSVLNTLHQIGMKIFPMSGYARSLYRYFTDIKLELPLPYNSGEGHVRNAREKNEIDKYEISPNPTDGNINIDYTISEGKRQLSVFDIEGTLIFTKVLDHTNNKTTVDMSNEINGMYIILIRDIDTGELNHSEKIILIK